MEVKIKKLIKAVKALNQLLAEVISLVGTVTLLWLAIKGLLEIL